MPRTTSANPIPVHFPPLRVKRTESGIGVSGVPQLGQTAACSETSPSQPRHLMSAIGGTLLPRLVLAHSNLLARRLVANRSRTLVATVVIHSPVVRASLISAGVAQRWRFGKWPLGSTQKALPGDHCGGTFTAGLQRRRSRAYQDPEHAKESFFPRPLKFMTARHTCRAINAYACA